MVLTSRLMGVQRRGVWVVEEGFMKPAAFGWDPDGKGDTPGKAKPGRELTEGAVNVEGGKA